MGATGSGLEARFRVVCVDHPGHGDEPLADVSDVGDLARHVLAHVAAERFSFVGASLGGAVGMRLALDVPERLDRLALLGSSARFGTAGLWRERAALVRAEGLDPIVDGALERWFTRAFPDVPRYREMLLTTNAEGYARCCDALARWDAREEVAAIAVPTLCVVGTDDPSAPPDDSELIASRVGEARLEVLVGARHLASVERADEVNRLLLEHL